ncbi:MAG: hypothetical protein WA989_18100 [Henriciella sp.]|uniref:hypothetical protein n=1 Tax=Henriciella sp. TaxID=1968823 RepID=UPI003C728BE7
MQILIKTALAASFAFTGALTASADMIELTSAEKGEVSQACKIGLPLIPVASDFGYETGQFALPISGQDGEVRSALIVSETALEEIPECKAEIEAFAEHSTEGKDAVS